MVFNKAKLPVKLSGRQTETETKKFRNSFETFLKLFVSTKTERSRRHRPAGGHFCACRNIRIFTCFYITTITTTTTTTTTIIIIIIIIKNDFRLVLLVGEG